MFPRTCLLVRPQASGACQAGYRVEAVSWEAVNPAYDDTNELPELEWLHRPTLRDPVMIAAFAGWNDAGDSASGCVDFLDTRWEAETFATLDSEEFYDFNATRPIVTITDEGERELAWPNTTFAAASVPGSLADVILVRGIEPNLRWRSFCDHILHVAHAMGVQRIITLGALLAEVTHTRAVPIYGASNNSTLQDKYDLAASTYQGPTGIVGVLTTLGAESGLPTMGLWAAVPSYVAGATSPKATEALITKTAEVLGTAVSTTELQDSITSYEQQVTEHISDDPETLALIAQLEGERDEYDAAMAKSENLADEVEQFLRDQ